MYERSYPLSLPRPNTKMTGEATYEFIVSMDKFGCVCWANCFKGCGDWSCCAGKYDSKLEKHVLRDERSQGKSAERLRDSREPRNQADRLSSRSVVRMNRKMDEFSVMYVTHLQFQSCLPSFNRSFVQVLSRACWRLWASSTGPWVASCRSGTRSWPGSPPGRSWGCRSWRNLQSIIKSSPDMWNFHEILWWPKA